MDQLMTKEKSYAERRQLFRDIWETSMNMYEKDNITVKPKVIKTLRLSDVDQCEVRKKKKQKLKKLRAVCNKLFDVCYRQDKENLFCEQTGGTKAVKRSEVTRTRVKTSMKIKRKIKSKSLLVPRRSDNFTNLQKNYVQPTKILKNTPLNVKL